MIVDGRPDAVADAIVALEAAGYAVCKSDLPRHWTVAGLVKFIEPELIRAAQALGVGLLRPRFQL
jgi:hypothetical protein